MVERKLLPIGAVGRRSGLAASAIRFYEQQGLLRAERSASGTRMYQPDVLRRLGFIRVAQRVGLSLAEIKDALDTLPEGRTPTRADWQALSAGWRSKLDEQVMLLERLRDDLDGCIGCGCLSLEVCRLYNPGDRAANLGFGPRYLLGDTADDAAMAAAESTERRDRRLFPEPG
jgi:MerR family transcriptional regulator, redox-sensitive transcriptional activator SoxR